MKIIFKNIYNFIKYFLIIIKNIIKRKLEPVFVTYSRTIYFNYIYLFNNYIVIIIIRFRQCQGNCRKQCSLSRQLPLY